MLRRITFSPAESATIRESEGPLQILDPMRKKVGAVAVMTVSATRMIPATMWSVKNASRVATASTTKRVTHPAVNASALFPGAPPIHGKSFNHASGLSPLR